MGKYGEAAILATTLLNEARSETPTDAWRQAVAKTFPDSTSSRNKSCPKSTFLSLCQEGLVIGITAGNYTRSIDNRRYALQAVKQLIRNPNLVDDESKLWGLVTGKERKVENSQMDVVITLWKNGLLTDYP